MAASRFNREWRSAALRIVAALLIVTQGLACYSWRQGQAPLTQPAATEKRGPVRVTTTDGRVFVVAQPHVTKDTLRGSSPSTGAPVAIPTSEIVRLETRQPDAGRTLLLFLGVNAAVAIVALAIYMYVALSDPNY